MQNLSEQTEKTINNMEQELQSGGPDQPQKDKPLLDILQQLGLTAKQRKKLIPLGIFLLIGIFFLFLSAQLGGQQAVQEDIVSEQSTPQEEEANSVSASADAQSEEAVLEEKLTNILQQVAGVGKVSVSLTFSESSKKDYAVNTSATVRNTEETNTDGGTKVVTEKTESGQMVLENNNAEPVMVQETMPTVQGVLIVAEGADDPAVCTQIARAAESLLDVPMYKVVICPMERSR